MVKTLALSILPPYPGDKGTLSLDPAMMLRAGIASRPGPQPLGHAFAVLGKALQEKEAEFARGNWQSDARIAERVLERRGRFLRWRCMPVRGGGCQRAQKNT